MQKRLIESFFVVWSIAVAGFASAADQSPGTMQFSQNAYSVAQSKGSIQITVNRVGGSKGAVGIHYATWHDTAAPPEYTGTSGIFRWKAGDSTPRTFEVPIDTTQGFNGSHAFSIHLDRPRGGVLVETPDYARVSIVGSSGSTSGGSSAPPSGGGSTSSGVTAAGTWPPPVRLTASPGSCTTSAMRAPAGSTTYDVGPGQKYTTLTGVPWLSLKPGDVVNVNYQPTPYATIIVMTTVGTAALPVTINGVTDADCNRPVLSGKNAVVAADAVAANYFGESPGSYMVGNGLINFAWPSHVYPYQAPSYITIQNLEITGAAAGNRYTSAGGASSAWSGSYGIYAVMFSNTTIQNCLIHGNDGGVFFNSQDALRTSSYVTLRDNIIYGNGVVGSYLYHNIYGQGYRTLYEGNWLGSEKAGADGSTLKDRSSGTVIRDNYIVASARAIDLVDSETDPTVINDPLYNYAWIYSNVIVDDFSLPQNSGDLIHWGGDSGTTANYHQGTLYFYFNTLVIRNITNNGTEVGIFDMSLPADKVEAHSNIFDFSNNAAAYWPVSLGVCCGTINFDDTNWITSGYSAQNSNRTGGTVVFRQNGTLLQGTNPGLNGNFTIAAGSPVIGHGALAPALVPSSTATLQNLQPTAQYGNPNSTVTSPAGTPSIISRGSVTDLGALESQ